MEETLPSSSTSLTPACCEGARLGRQRVLFSTASPQAGQKTQEESQEGMETHYTEHMPHPTLSPVQQGSEKEAGRGSGSWSSSTSFRLPHRGKEPTSASSGLRHNSCETFTVVPLERGTCSPIPQSLTLTASQNSLSPSRSLALRRSLLNTLNPLFSTTAIRLPL